jgi:lysozyme
MNTVAVSLIKSGEGFRRFVYKCPAGKLTIGYGLNLEDRGVSEEEAEFLLHRYVVELERSMKLAKPVFATLSGTRQAALLSMAYNLGVNGLLGFKRMWAAIENGRFVTASAHALESKWAEQVGKRAERLAHIIATDHLEWDETP